MAKPTGLNWQYRGDYIRTRSRRRPGDTDIDPAWADEAFADDAALVDRLIRHRSPGRLTGSLATP